MMKPMAEISVVAAKAWFCDRTDQAKPEAVNIRRQFRRTFHLRFDFY